LCGDPLDMILFRQTGWVLDEPNVIEETGRFDSMVPTVVRSPGDHFGQEAPIELGIVRQFTFSSNLQRMSVFVRRLGESDMTLYCKGAPEKIASLCRDETIPSDFFDMVNKYAQRGYRLIALARRSLQMTFVKAQRVSRESVECDLELLGLVMLENRLKPQTVGVIHQLKKAHIRTIMVTGDNLLTAMSVARECGLLECQKRSFIVELSDTLGRDGPRLVLQEVVSSAEENNLIEPSFGEIDAEVGKVVDSNYQIAIAGSFCFTLLLNGQLIVDCSGTTFAVIFHQYPELLDKLVCVCDVFARMSPDQKQLLVNHLQTVDYTVAMCGDGANDCGALKVNNFFMLLMPPN
jgi:cation-transporting ATPase 13A3/4/5